MTAKSNIYGHFKSLWTNSNGMIIPTSMTSQRKSKSRALEIIKKAKLINEIKRLTGDPKYVGISRMFDEVQRRWPGIKNNDADG